MPPLIGLLLGTPKSRKRESREAVCKVKTGSNTAIFSALADSADQLLERFSLRFCLCHLMTGAQGCHSQAVKIWSDVPLKEIGEEKLSRRPSYPETSCGLNIGACPMWSLVDSETRERERAVGTTESKTGFPLYEVQMRPNSAPARRPREQKVER